jgi:hypothetical protein
MWFVDFHHMRAQRGEYIVVYWRSGPRQCNECFWMVPNPEYLGWTP